METVEDAPLVIQIARLLEIIQRDNEAIKRHQSNGLSSIIEQYEVLRAEHLAELKQLMAVCGVEAEFKAAA